MARLWNARGASTLQKTRHHDPEVRDERSVGDPNYGSRDRSRLALAVDCGHPVPTVTARFAGIPDRAYWAGGIGSGTLLAMGVICFKYAYIAPRSSSEKLRKAGQGIGGRIDRPCP